MVVIGWLREIRESLHVLLILDRCKYARVITIKLFLLACMMCD